MQADNNPNSSDELECPDCYEPVDEDGDTLQDPEQACCMAGAWSHQGDCNTCGYIACDGSC